MDYYMLDEALELLEGNDFYESVDFILQDINESMLDIESVLEAEDSAVKETIWQKIKAAFVKVIQFIKAKVCVLIAKALAKVSKIAFSVAIKNAKKVDKKNQLSKISLKILDYKDFYNQLKSCANGKIDQEFELHEISVTIDNFAAIIADSAEYFAKIADCMRIIGNKMQRTIADIDAKNGSVDDYRTNIHVATIYGNTAYRYTNVVLVLCDKVGSLCSKIKANPDADCTELINQINKLGNADKNEKK